jgi:hypothetical protein
VQAEPTYATRRTPSRWTDGGIVAESIERWLGRRPTPSQRFELDVALERVDGPGSPYAYDEVIIIKGRRCGKTVTSFGVPHARALNGPVTLSNGRVLPFRAVHVAQNLTSARQRFAEDLVDPYRQRFTDAGWASAAEYRRGAADTALLLDPRSRKDIERAKIDRVASEIRVLAPTPSAARGAGVFHRTYDEELTFDLERGQELAAAGRPTMAELQGQAQTWHMSNISRDTGPRHFLFAQREKGRRHVAAGSTTGVCYVEYSIPPGVELDDEREWFRYYPALGEGLVGIAQLRRDREEFEEINRDGGAAFYAEYLGRWADENDTGSSGWEAIRESDFAAALVDELAMPDDVDVVLGVELDPFFRSATITAAAQIDPDTVLVEIVDHRPDTEWVLDALLQYAGAAAAVCVDAYGPGLALLEKLERMPVFSDRLVVTRGGDFYAACYGFESGLRDRSLKIRRSDYHERLTAAAAAAQRTTGRSWGWQRQVNPPQTPLVSATLAVWALSHAPTPADVSRIF